MLIRFGVKLSSLPLRGSIVVSNYREGVECTKAAAETARIVIAEYGNALCGVVNIVTIEGGQKYTGELLMYSGDFLSRRKNIFLTLIRLIHSITLLSNLA